MYLGGQNNVDVTRPTIVSLMVKNRARDSETSAGCWRNVGYQSLSRVETGVAALLLVRHSLLIAPSFGVLLPVGTAPSVSSGRRSCCIREYPTYLPGLSFDAVATNEHMT